MAASGLNACMDALSFSILLAQTSICDICVHHPKHPSPIILFSNSMSSNMVSLIGGAGGRLE